jgi:hypothetical protein
MVTLTTESIKTPVLIVGAGKPNALWIIYLGNNLISSFIGPVGLTLAWALARHGIQVFVAERSHHSTRFPKMEYAVQRLKPGSPESDGQPVAA